MGVSKVGGLLLGVSPEKGVYCLGVYIGLSLFLQSTAYIHV